MVYYIPHHAVYKPSSTTTKTRLVFDASAKSTNGISLNDNLLIGPRLQDDICPNLIRFRTHEKAFASDVPKMYRQTNVHPEDCDYQRILWRKSTDEPISEFRLTTATFGTAAAPYLAVKCLQQTALDFISANPGSDHKAANIILKDFYVDDLMSGASSDTEAITLKDEILNIMATSKMELRKWSSNSNALLESLPPELRETKFPLRIDEDDSVKTLGLTWNPASDMFSISVVTPPTRETITRRTLLSDVAKTFDPLGLLSPATIKAKLILQSLWKEKQDWDEPIPTTCKEMWLEYLDEFPTYNKLQIPRCITTPGSEYELHGFCDASQVAYSACVYLRSVNPSEEVQVRLVCAKTKVAPIKYVSIARLELCGATLLSKLMDKVKVYMNLPISKIAYWSDSTIVLAWIASPSSRWKIFVANRVAKIQESSSSDQWNHVRGDENPADCASRGINPSTLMNHSLWWNGPQWLQSPTASSESSPIGVSHEETILEEEKKIVTSHHTSTNDNNLLSRCSTLLRLQRVTAYMKRCLRRKSFKAPGPPTVHDQNSALDFWIRNVQLQYFKETITAIRKRQPIPASGNQLKHLSPFLDPSGILRVGGRLQNANITPDRKHPILLPKKNHLTTLVVEHYHRIYGHGGNQLLLASLQTRFWILGAKDIVRQLIRKCIPCHRVRAETAQQMMGNLPAPRVNRTRPFKTCGVDFAGPFQLLLKKGRGQKPQKFYVAVFICFVVRAIHLELVSDLTTEAFLAAFRRFVSRRGLCADVYSDCGTNFVGASAELKTYLKNIKSSTLGTHIKESLAKDGITWHFNPPSAPHFGGLWEAGVKSFKYHFKRIIGNHTLTTEEMMTVLAQIEACLNSRPLTALSTDPNDLMALTPGHFLVGDALLAIPEPDVTDLKTNTLSRWQLTQQLYQHFWNRWSSEYLSRLQQRPKWWSESKNVEVGDLVLLKDERLPSLKWKLGRVLKVFPGQDELVRAVEVKTADGIFSRPIAKLCPLPIDK